MMNRRLLVALSVLTAASSVAGAQRPVSVRHAIAPDASIRLGGNVGTIRVIGWEKDSIVMTGTLPGGARLDGGVAGGDAKSGGVSRNAKFFIDAPSDAAAKGGGTGALELRVPSRARVWIKSGTANVEVRGMSGGMDVNVIGGSVRIVSSPRELQVEAMDAAVTIEGNPAWLRAKTATGDISLHGSSQDAVLTTVSGTVRVDGGSLERARIETVTGAILFAADFAPGGDVAFDTHSGEIELRLAHGGGEGSGAAMFEVAAASVTGTVANLYSATRVIPYREQRGQEVNILGGSGEGRGSAHVVVRTFKGAITLRRR